MTARYSLFLLAVLTAACSSNDAEPSVDCSTVTATFSADAAPVIQATCAAGGSGCHGSGSSQGPGPLTNYNQIFAARNAIRSSVAVGRMPKGTPLSATQKSKIICWIESGAANN